MIKYNKEAKERQIFLQEKSFYTGKIDGLFGAKSKKAERKYLQSIGKLKQPAQSLSLREHRCAFTSDIAKLIQYAIEKGYECAGDDLKSSPACKIHMNGSQHYKGLALDLLLYLKGIYLRKTSDHQLLGEFWESLSPFNRWGGRYSDGNHYERLQRHFREDF